MRATRPVKLKKAVGSEHKIIKCKQVAAKIDKRAMKLVQKPAKLEQKPAKLEPKAAEPKPQRVKPQRQVPPESKPAKHEQKADKVVSEADKTESKLVKSANKVTAAAAAGEVERAYTPSVEPEPEPGPDGHYELSPLMTRMLEVQLQRIMIKVWQELPDEPPSEAEKLVADKLRNQAGDDLRNVLGLNVTKRLLNIHNALLVQVTFSRKPEAADLKSLLRNYNCAGIKRTVGDRREYSFVVHMRTIADFDRICKDRVIQCGVARAHVAPSYNFRQCPTKLKTIYNETTSTIDEATDKDTTAGHTASENKSVDSSPDKKTEISEKKATESPEKKAAEIPEKKTAIIPGTKGTDIPEKKVAEISEKKAVEIAEKKAAELTEKKIVQVPQKKLAAVTEKKTEIAEKATAIPEKKATESTVKKTVQQKKMGEVTDKKIAETQDKQAAEVTKKIVTPSSDKKIEVSQPKKTQISENKNAIETAIANKKTTDNVENKVEETKNIRTVSNKAPIKNIANRIVKTVSENIPKVVKLNKAKTGNPSAASKTFNKQNPKKIIGSKSNVNKNVKSVNIKKRIKPKVAQGRNKLTDMIILDDDEFDENDELNDDDILALMSGAIVLDECSGSGEE